MLRRKLTLIFWILCALQFATSRPTNESTTNDTKAALISVPVKPDVELINFEGVIKPDEDAYRRAAASNGMDPAIVAEVIRNGKPVVKTEFDASGAKRTTTYKLEPDGSISRHTLTEYTPTVQTVQRPTFVSSPTTNVGSNKEQDWEWNPTTVPRFGTPTNTQTFNFPQYTPTWTRPVFTNYQPFGSGSFLPENPSQAGTPISSSPDLWNPGQWPHTNTFAQVDPTNTGTVTKTLTTDDGTKVTTTHTVGPTKWTTHTYTYPASSNFPEVKIQTTTPFPSLEEFLKSHTTTTIPNLVPGNTPVTKINIDDLPAVQLPTSSQSTQSYTVTLHTNGNPTAANLDPKMREILEKAGIDPQELLNSKNGTITKTRREPDGRLVTTTYRVRTVPSGQDDNSILPNYEPPSFPNSFDFDKPRGPFFIIPTTTAPPPPHGSSSRSGVNLPTVQVPELTKHNFVPNERRSVPPSKPQARPIAPVFTAKNSIEEFLAKVGLTPATIEASNGEVIKTFVDDKGRVLTATFVLSTVKNSEMQSQDNDKKNPIK